MKSKWPTWMRTLHRWGTVLVVIPFFIVLVSGIVLQVKKEVAWVQPPTQRGAGDVPTLSFDEILAAARTAEEASIQTWADVDRLDVRPDKGVVKVRGTNRWEVQLDAQTGEVLHVALRRSDLIESIHDGSWFHDAAKLWIFLPTAIVVLGLWGTGVYLFYLPYGVRWRRKKPSGPPAEAHGVKKATLPDAYRTSEQEAALSSD